MFRQNRLRSKTANILTAYSLISSRHIYKAQLDSETAPQCNSDMNSIANLSAQQLRRAASIRDQLDSLNVELNRLLGASNDQMAPVGTRTMSASARRKIAAAQKARWAKVKGNATQGTKRKMSAAGRKRIAAAAKARWAKAKAAGRKSL
jgi:hypothetical protein